MAENEKYRRFFRQNCLIYNLKASSGGKTAPNFLKFRPHPLFGPKAFPAKIY